MSQETRQPLAVELEAIQDTDLASAGGKAVNLARLIRAGLPVPPGFCLTTAAYRMHLHEAHLAGRVESRRAATRLEPGDAPGDESALADLRQAIIDAPVPPAVEAEVQRAWEELQSRRAGTRVGEGPLRLAVRSSATTEDLPDLSFAGLHDTVLGVASLPECLDAVRRCWASLWTRRAFEYRRKNSVPHAGAAMAVIVQQLIPADVAGVIFTADPVSGRRDVAVIEAARGLGEALVSGRVAPDRIVLSRPDLAVRAEPPAPRESCGACLDDASAARVARLAIRAEEALGSSAPLDVEWALAGGQAWLLQARAITALGRARSWEDRQVWTNANAGEVLPDVATPMTWSVVQPVGQKLLTVIFAKLGVEVGGNPLLGRIAGRAYFNLNTILGAVRHLPGMRDKDLGELFGGRQDLAAALGQIRIPPEDIPDLKFSRLKAAWRVSGFLLDFLLFAPGESRRLLARMQRRAEREDRIARVSPSDRDLARHVAGSFREFVGAVDAFVLLGVAVTYQTALYDVCRRWFGASGGALASRLMTGLGNNENANAGLAMWRLAVLADRHAEVRSAVLGETSFEELRDRIAPAEGGREFLDAWDRFMREHGHHCRGELELMNPRWSQMPDEVLAQVRSHVAAVGEGDFLARYRRLAAARAAAAAQCRRGLRNPLKRACFEFLLRRAARYAPLRETVKSRMVRRLAAMRRMLLELGARLVKTAILRVPQDIFFLTIQELEPACGPAPPGRLRQTAAARRAEYETNLSLRPPAVVVGRFDPDRAAPPAAGAREPGAKLLTGVAVNPGVVTGPARVILRAGDQQVRPGEVLVAPFTDPGWTPYFLNAAAIVMDLGGLLSHGSIIAREFGIPAVVNVGPATEIIRTGQTLRVDGTRGTVEILE